MSEQKPDGDSAVKPQVIDLEAEDVRADPSGAPAYPDDESDARADMASPPPPVRGGRGRAGLAGWTAAALVLGLLGGAWIYRDVLSSYFPTDEMTALRVRLDALETGGNSLGEQVAALGRAAEGASQAATAAETAARAAADGVSTLASRADALDARIVSAEAALNQARTDLEGLRNALSTAGTGTATGTGMGDGGSAVIAALGQRIDALEKDMASLKSGAGTGGDTATQTTALSQALADLKAKVAAGAGFQAEHDRIARMVPAAEGLDVLARAAATGLPPAAGLAAELRAAIPALPQPEAPPAEPDGYWDSLVETLSGIITIRDIGEADWPQLAERAAAFAEAGDLAQAIGVVDAAEGVKPSALSQWRERAAGRLALEAAVAQVSDAVLRQIAALGGQP